MVYFFLRLYFLPALVLWYRRVHTTNFHFWNKNKPTILAINHPNAVMEPGILLYLSWKIHQKPLHFLTRGDAFHSKIGDAFLRHIKALPVYSIGEIEGSKHKNEVSYAGLYAAFKSENAHLEMAPEGITKIERRLRELKKGIGWLAIKAVKEHDLDLEIVPMSVNFTYETRFRKEILLQANQPINIKNYIQNNANLTDNQLIELILTDLKMRLEEHMILVKKPENDEIAELRLDIFRNELPERQTYFNKILIDDRQGIYLKAHQQALNNIEHDKEKTHLNRYLKTLESHNLTDFGVKNQPFSFIQNLFLYAGMPFFALAIVLHGLPILLTRLVMPKFRIMNGRPEFFASVLWCVFNTVNLFYYLMLLVVGVFVHWKMGFLLGITLVGLAVFSCFYYEIWQDSGEKWRFANLSKPIKKILTTQRSQVIETMRQTPKKSATV